MRLDVEMTSNRRITCIIYKEGMPNEIPNRYVPNHSQQGRIGSVAGQCECISYRADRLNAHHPHHYSNIHHPTRPCRPTGDVSLTEVAMELAFEVRNADVVILGSRGTCFVRSSGDILNLPSLKSSTSCS